MPLSINPIAQLVASVSSSISQSINEASSFAAGSNMLDSMDWPAMLVEHLGNCLTERLQSAAHSQEQQHWVV
jgi:hypothetical protein